MFFGLPNQSGRQTNTRTKKDANGATFAPYRVGVGDADRATTVNAGAG